MAVLLKNGAIFLHVPKTGGSWVTGALRECGLVEREIGHIHADAVRVMYYRTSGKALWRSVFEYTKSRLPRALKARIMTPDRRRRMAVRRQISQPFMFCFVRHPLRWYESWWRYMNARSGSDWAAESDLLGWHPCGAIKHCGDDEFTKFIRNVIDQRPGFVTELYAQYVQPEIGFVGRQEQLTEDLIQVLNQLDANFDEQQIREQTPVNVSPRDNDIVLPEELRDELVRTEYAAMRRFGYDDDSRQACGPMSN